MKTSNPKILNEKVVTCHLVSTVIIMPSYKNETLALPCQNFRKIKTVAYLVTIAKVAITIKDFENVVHYFVDKNSNLRF